MVEALNLALREEMERDKRVIVLGEDVGREGGVFSGHRWASGKIWAGRVIDTPLAESGIVGTAFGMAVNGLRPIAEIQFEGFLYPASIKFRTTSDGFETAPGAGLPLPWSSGSPRRRIHAPPNTIR